MASSFRIRRTLAELAKVALLDSAEVDIDKSWGCGEVLNTFGPSGPSLWNLSRKLKISDLDLGKVNGGETLRFITLVFLWPCLAVVWMNLFDG